VISARQMRDISGGRTPRPRYRGIGLGKARSSISAALVRVAGYVGPEHQGQDTPTQAGPPRLDPGARRRVAESLGGELSDMLEDAAKREITEEGAKALLLTAEIVLWLREGEELPGDGAIGLLEIHVAVFNGAPHEEERQPQRDLLAVLLALVDAQAHEIHSGRWRHRRVNVEAAETRERRKFGKNVDRLRQSRGLTIGELAARAHLEVLAAVELIHAARDASWSEIRRLAGALDVEPGALLPDPPDGGAAAPAETAYVEDGPRGEEDR
jgi:hypothetical protein